MCGDEVVISERLPVPQWKGDDVSVRLIEGPAFFPVAFVAMAPVR